MLKSNPQCDGDRESPGPGGGVLRMGLVSL
jgi:hypothetical protein